MPGLRITIPTTFTDTSLPILRADSLLPESGALILIDPAHPATGDLTLSSGMTVPNIAAALAAELAEGTTGAMHPELAFGGIGTTATAKGVVELSDKGGIHTIMSPTASLVAGDGVVIRPSQSIVDYLVANTGHSYYVSLWMRPTRLAGLGMGYTGLSLATTASSISAAKLYAINSSGDFYPTTAPRIGSAKLPATLAAGTSEFLNGAVSAYSGTPEVSGSAARDRTKAWGVGHHLPFNILSGGSPSAILYRYYLEDLTVSGRTYAEVHALDHALYTQEVTTSGGRYYGDTYTDPATIP